MIKNILWDFDGTLLDTYPAVAQAMQRCLASLGKEVPLTDIFSLCKISMRHCMQTLADQTQLSFAQIEAGFDQESLLIPLHEQPPFPGVQEVLSTILQSGGKNIIITHRDTLSLQKLLNEYELASYFSGWISADDGFPRKPHPSAFFAALQSFQLLPSETLGIGDRALDIEAARAAGIKTAFFGRPPDGLQVDFVIENYQQLIPLLSN